MSTFDSNQRINGVLELAGLDPHTHPSLLVRNVLDSLNSQPLQFDTEFDALLQQIIATDHRTFTRVRRQ